MSTMTIYILVLQLNLIPDGGVWPGLHCGPCFPDSGVNGSLTDYLMYSTGISVHVYVRRQYMCCQVQCCQGLQSEF